MLKGITKLRNSETNYILTEIQTSMLVEWELRSTDGQVMLWLSPSKSWVQTAWKAEPA